MTQSHPLSPKETGFMHRPYTPNCTGKDLTNFKLRERKRELVKGVFFSAIATNMPIYLVQKLRVIDMIALRYRNTELRGNTYTVTPPKVMNNLSLHLSLSLVFMVLSYCRQPCRRFSVNYIEVIEIGCDWRVFTPFLVILQSTPRIELHNRYRLREAARLPTQIYIRIFFCLLNSIFVLLGEFHFNTRTCLYEFNDRFEHIIIV